MQRRVPGSPPGNSTTSTAPFDGMAQPYIFGKMCKKGQFPYFGNVIVRSEHFSVQLWPLGRFPVQERTSDACSRLMLSLD